MLSNNNIKVMAAFVTITFITLKIITMIIKAMPVINTLLMIMKTTILKIIVKIKKKKKNSVGYRLSKLRIKYRIRILSYLLFSLSSRYPAHSSKLITVKLREILAMWFKFTIPSLLS